MDTEGILSPYQASDLRDPAPLALCTADGECDEQALPEDTSECPKLLLWIN